MMGKEWKPIGEAPKDGTEILCAEKVQGDFLKPEWEIRVCFWDTTHNYWEASEYSAFAHNPTHWMPLPAFPEEELIA